jgi:hypothetical protein
VLYFVSRDFTDNVLGAHKTEVHYSCERQYRGLEPSREDFGVVKWDTLPCDVESTVWHLVRPWRNPPAASMIQQKECDFIRSSAIALSSLSISGSKDAVQVRLSSLLQLQQPLQLHHDIVPHRDDTPCAGAVHQDSRCLCQDVWGGAWEARPSAKASERPHEQPGHL